MKTKNVASYGEDKERILWVNVVLQAIRDATDARGTDHTDFERSRARVWFSLKNPDFIEVCHCANLDPEATLEKAKAAIRRYDEIVAAGEEYRLPHNIKDKAPPSTKTPARLITYRGESRTVTAWAKVIGISHSSLLARLSSGHSVEEALSPNFKRKPRRIAGNPFGRRAKKYTIGSETKTIAQWASSIGVEPKTLAARMRKGRSLEVALAMPPKDRGRGVVSNFAPSMGTGAGSTAQENAEITFSENEASQ
ncbi:hypothetical protein ABFT80_00815 [Mesorhizobium sp. SB112]|uniref:hypothetical protein n=1 Tax=Mesorhizobium sp. SB112 TaxID=3151853 RepID=UPI0032643BD8